MLPHNNIPTGYRILILLLFISGAATLLVSSASAGTGVTISADGDQSYYLGEVVVLRGQNTDSESTYLFLTGPNLQVTGVKLTMPDMAAVSGNPDSFTIVKTKPDKTWEYPFYTANLELDAGTYTIYALSQLKTKDQPDTDAAQVGLIIKKPFIIAEISSPEVNKGQLFTINGTAEGIPTTVQIWIFGEDYVFTTKNPVNPDASFTFKGDATMSGRLPTGQNYIIVQHPMQNNQFDIDVSGDYVRSLQLNNGTNIFRISGPGSLQGNDAAEALAAALSDDETRDDTYTQDTYTIFPFLVTGAGSPTSPTTTAITAPVQQPTRPDLLHLAMAGAIVMVVGIVIWKRE